MSHLEKLSKEQCFEIINMEFEENDINNNNKSLSQKKNEIDLMITHANKYKIDIDIESDDNNLNNRNLINNENKKQKLDSLDNDYITENLNEKYNFQLGIITLFN